MLTLFVFLCRFELLSGVILFQPKVLPCVYLVWLVSEEQILSPFVYYKYFYSLAVFKILSFDDLILTYMYIDHFEFIPLINRWVSWMCRSIFFITFGRVSANISSMFFLTLCVSSFLGVSHYLYVGVFNCVLKVSESLPFSPQPFCFLILKLNTLNWSFFNFSESFLCQLKCAVQTSTTLLFQLLYFSTQNFYWVHWYNFYLIFYILILWDITVIFSFSLQTWFSLSLLTHIK